MKKLIMTDANQQILNQICQLAAKGAQQVALEQLENMIQTLNKSMEDIQDETNKQPFSTTLSNNATYF